VLRSAVANPLYRPKNDSIVLQKNVSIAMRTRTRKSRKPVVSAVPVDPDDFARTPEESEAFHAEMESLLNARQHPENSRSIAGSQRPFPPAPLTRSQIDQTYRTAVLLGGWNPVPTTALCEDIIRLHDVLATVAHCLDRGDTDAGLGLVRPELDPAWASPLDVAALLRDDGNPGQREVSAEESI
jgi:hypothetical protein